jgi:hypothetical protein
MMFRRTIGRRLLTQLNRNTLRYSPSIRNVINSKQVRYFGQELNQEELGEYTLYTAEDGQRCTKIYNEEIAVPWLEWTLEWVLNTPPDYHSFDETPVIVETTFPENFMTAEEYHRTASKEDFEEFLNHLRQQDGEQTVTDMKNRLGIK